ncbi:MAG: hypothetical protein KDB53_10860, partial [Planctomycetes bacterium]|nr:hypothetical protein [Planctomycetota bacterium]
MARPREAFAALLVLCFLGTATAQFDQNGPNAVLTLQGVVPSVADPIDHDVAVQVPGRMEMNIATNANLGMPLLLIASPLDPMPGGNVFPVPWGGSVDIGSPGATLPQNVIVIGDGLSLSAGPLDIFFASNQGSPALGRPPEFVLTLAVGNALGGARLAFQALVQDPSSAPFNLDNTEAVDANFVNGQTVVVNPTASNGAQVPFLAGKTFSFHGVSYSDVWLNSSGFLNFGGGSSLPSGGFTIDAMAFTAAEPAIALFMADWDSNFGGSVDNSIVLEEIGNTVRIAFGDPAYQVGGTLLSHFGGSDMNRFEATLELQDAMQTNPNAGRFSINIIQSDPTASVQNGSGLIGHTPGGLAIVSGAFDTDLHQPQTAMANVAMIEEHNNNNSNASTLGWDGLGSLRAYNWFHSWSGHRVDFVPVPPLAIPGDLGYTSTASALPADDLRGTVPASLDVNGNQLITVVGKFHGFYSAAGVPGTVVFDPNGLALPAAVVGLIDNTLSTPASLPNPANSGPFRDFEGLQVLTPVFPATGTYTMQANFMNGTSLTVPVTVSNGGVTVTTYSTLNTSSAGTSALHQHVLQSPVTFYGQTYTSLWIAGHGYVTFGTGVSDFSESINEFFAGWQPTPTVNARPGVAVFWSDLNRNDANSMAVVTEDM